MFHTIGFVGGGRVSRFLLEGWARAGKMPGDVRVTDTNGDVLAALERDFPSIAKATLQEAAAADLVVLALHPPVLREVMGMIKASVKPHATVMSLAPKITAAGIAQALGVQRVVRMIPNAPSAIGQGYNPVNYSGVDDATKAALRELFAPWGVAPEVREPELEAYAMISAMGPTYMWFQWQTLRELAVSFGLSQQAADEAILATIAGAARCLLASGRNPEEVMDMIPVRPLKDDEPAIVASYRSRLPALLGKLRP